MPTDTSAPEETETRSEEDVRNHLLRFLRLVAKDVVWRLADAGLGGIARSNGAETSEREVQ